MNILALNNIALLAGIITGNSSDNSLKGGSGSDTIFGYEGNDTIIGNTGADYLDGGLHNDWLDGGSNNDTLLGGLGNDTLIGGSAEDSLLGAEGNDSLTGGSGDDTLAGGTGNDTLMGGSGDDNFVIVQNPGGTTLIQDFSKTHDHIDVTDLGINFADLLITQDGADTLINTPGNQQIRLAKFLATDLSEAYFLGLGSGGEEPGITLIGTDLVSSSHNGIFFAGRELSEFQFVNVDGDASQEFFGIYNNELWKYDQDTSTWEKQYFANGLNGAFQFVNTDGDASQEFYGVYGNNLWHYDLDSHEWQQQFFANGITGDFQFINTDADSTLEFYGMYGDVLWKYDPDIHQWERQYFAGNPQGFQFINLDNDASLEFLGNYAGRLWKYDPGAGWAEFTDIQTGTNPAGLGTFQVTDWNNDGATDYVGNFPALPGSTTLVSFTKSHSGNDLLVGTANNDTFIGKTGNDTMTGNGGSDTFKFADHLNHDVVTDFNHGDKLDFTALSGGLDATAILAASAVSAGNTVITLSVVSSVTLIGFTDLTAADIIA